MDVKKLLAAAPLTLISGYFLLAVSCASFRIANRVPPPDITPTRLAITYQRIEDYWNKNGATPTKPTDLPAEPGRDFALVDGWGNDFGWDSGDNKVKVWSLGRDEKPGGTGDDADLQIEFVGRQWGQHDTPAIRRSDAS